MMSEKKVRFLAIPSVPCFELWLLIHFVVINSRYDRREVIRRLKEKIPGYEKGSEGVYAATEACVQIATDRAITLQGSYDCLNGRDPYTGVNEIVSKLRAIRPA